MIESGIVVIGPGQHNDADAVLAFELVEYLPRALANAGLVLSERHESRLDGAIVFFRREPEDRLPGL